PHQRQRDQRHREADQVQPVRDRQPGGRDQHARQRRPGDQPDAAPQHVQRARGADLLGRHQPGQQRVQGRPLEREQPRLGGGGRGSSALTSSTPEATVKTSSVSSTINRRSRASASAPPRNAKPSTGPSSTSPSSPTASDERVSWYTWNATATNVACEPRN